tara:strand:- start:1755 stop:2165 length:411 start_codon:yes stop_codon:yes gene_type:complete
MIKIIWYRSQFSYLSNYLETSEVYEKYHRKYGSREKCSTILSINSLSKKTTLESKEKQKSISDNHEFQSSKKNNGQSEIYIKILEKKVINYSDLTNIIRKKWIFNKDTVLKFIDDLYYKNRIQRTYYLTLLERKAS